MSGVFEVMQPDPGRLIGALSHIGYRLEDSLSDLVDNAVSAGATQVLIRFLHDGEHVREILVADNGTGMTGNEVSEAMRFGSVKSSDPLSLGKFGLGMKLASMSYCDELSVYTRKNGSASGRCWTVDGIAAGWMCETIDAPESKEVLSRPFAEIDLGVSGTVIRWRNPKNLPTHKSGIRSIIGLIERKLRLHLGMRFHKFIERGDLSLMLDQQLEGSPNKPYWIEIEALNPFDYPESGSKSYPKKFTTSDFAGLGPMTFEAHVWPPKSESENYRLGKRAASYQGFFVYRKDRLIQAGGWFGTVNDEAEPHSSLARIKLDLPESTEELFALNVQKSTVIPPIGFQDAVRSAKSHDGTQWEAFRAEAIGVYRGSGLDQKRVKYKLGKGFAISNLGTDGDMVPLKLKWATKKRAPLVDFDGDALIFNPGLNDAKNYDSAEKLLATLGVILVGLLNDPKNSLRSKEQSAFFKSELEAAFNEILGS